MKTRVIFFARAAKDWADRHRLLLGGALGAMLALLLALYNVSSGPLHNLNDIGGWRNRALFIAMSAAVHGAALLLCAVLGRVSFPRIALRQVLVTVGYYIMLLGINHKTYHYLQLMQPVIRAMDAGSLAAGLSMEHGLSAPALLLTYLITRGPVYDMYLLKLFAIACYLLIALLILRFADRRNLGIRSEVLLALCMILPQGFTNAACSAVIDVAAVALLGASLALLFDADKERPLGSMLLFGLACAVSGACVCALPAYLYAGKQGRVPKKLFVLAAAVPLALCVPAVFGGMSVADAFAGLFGANLGLPAYASGAPGLMNLVPRAAVQEMPQYAPILRHFEELDLVTHAQPYYTQAHFEQMAAGMVLVSLALCLGVWALVWRMKDKPAIHRLLTLVLGVLIACPNVTSGAWLAIDVLCLYALLAAPKLRLPACMVLFATMCSSSYPMTEEVMLPMVYAFALCLGALCMLLDVIPMGREVKAHD